jgi:hypothetical protein
MSRSLQESRRRRQENRRRRQESRQARLNSIVLQPPPLPPSWAAVRARLHAGGPAGPYPCLARPDGLRVPDARWHRRIVC